MIRAPSSLPIPCLAVLGRILLVSCLLHAVDAGAHLFLTAETLEDALERIGELRKATCQQGDEPEDHEPLFRLGEAARDLTELMNEEVRTHGLEQWALMTEGVERAEALGIALSWSDDHQRFFYDGEPYRRYLELAPDGAFAADSRYRLIELDFYLGPADSIEALEAKAKNEREFLETYPDFPASARIGLFLGIDYRDLYRLCVERDDTACANEYARLAIEQFRTIAEAHPKSDSGEIARRLLRRTQGEVNLPTR